MAELSFLGLTCSQEEKYPKDNNVEEFEHLINFSCDSSNVIILDSIGSQNLSSTTRSPINLMDFSFNLINISSDSKDGLQTNEVSEDKEEGNEGHLHHYVELEEENIDSILNQLILNLIDHVEQNYEKDSLEYENKENVRPSNYLLEDVAFRKNLSFDLLEAKVEQERHKPIIQQQKSLNHNNHQRLILKEIDLGFVEEHQSPKSEFRPSNENPNEFSFSNNDESVQTVIRNIQKELYEENIEEPKKICIEINRSLSLQEHKKTDLHCSYDHLFDDITLNDNDYTISELSLPSNAMSETSRSKENFEDNGKLQHQQKVINVEMKNPKETFTINFPFEHVSLDKITFIDDFYDKSSISNLEQQALKTDNDQPIEEKAETEIINTVSHDESYLNSNDEIYLEAHTENMTLSESVNSLAMRTQTPLKSHDSYNDCVRICSLSSGTKPDSFVTVIEEYNQEKKEQECEVPLIPSPSSEYPRAVSNQKFYLNQLNVSPCSQKIDSPKNFLMNASTEEISFSYQDYLELLQTKVEYENQIVDLKEQLENQKVVEQIENTKLKEQLCCIQEEYKSYSKKSEVEIQKLRIDSMLLEEKLAQQKIQYESFIGQLEESMELAHLENSNLKHKYETTLVMQMNELKQHYGQLLQQFYESQNENRKLNEAIMEMDQQRCHLRQTINSLNSDLQDINIKLLEMTRERDQLTARLNDISTKSLPLSEDIQSKLNDAQKQIESFKLLTKKHEDLEAKYQKLTEEHQTHLKKWEHECFVQNDLHDQIAVLNSIIGNIHQEINELSEKLQKRTDRLNENRFDLNEQMEKFMKLKVKFDKMGNEDQDLKQIIYEDETKMKQLEVKLQDSEFELAKLKAENQNLQKSLLEKEKHSKKYCEMEKEIQDLKSENERLLESNTSLEEENNKMEYKLFECEERNIAIESKLEQMEQQSLKIKMDFESKESDLINKIDDIGQKLQEKERESEQTKKSLQEECQKLHEEIHKTESSLQELRCSYADLFSKHEVCDKVQEENDRSREELESVRIERKKLIEQIETSQNEWQKSKQKLLFEQEVLQQSNNKMAQRLSELTDLVQELTTKNSEFETKLRNSKEQSQMKYDELSQHLIQLERTKSELESKVSLFTSKNEKISSEYSIAEKRWAEEKSLMEQKLLASQKRLSSIDSELMFEKSEKLSLQKALESMQSSLEETKSKLAEHEEETERSRNQLRQHLQDLQEQQLKINSLAKDNSSLKYTITKLESSVSEHQAEIEDYRKNLKQLESSEQDSREKNQQLENQLKQLISDVETLSARYKQVSGKYQLVKRLTSDLKCQINYQTDMGQKLSSKIGKLMTKIDANKKDSIPNEKVKEMLESIGESNEC